MASSPITPHPHPTQQSSPCSPSSPLPINSLLFMSLFPPDHLYMSSQTQNNSMQNFYPHSMHTPLIDNHHKESNETKLDFPPDLPALTPELLLLPLKEQSLLLKDCLTSKADPDNHFLWKLIHSQNYWHIVSSIYFQSVDEINLRSVEKIRGSMAGEAGRQEGKGVGLGSLSPEKAEMEDKIFIFQTRILASNTLPQPTESIDEMIELWERELGAVTGEVDTRLSLIGSAMEDSKLQIENLNQMMFPAVYRPDLVHFQYMEIEDIEARKCSQNLQRRNRAKTMCCVCNHGEIEDCTFLECQECGNVIHDKCYLLNMEMSEREKVEFVCWSCSNPDTVNYNGMKCALCSVEGGIMGPSELDSNHELVVRKYYPPVMFELQGLENEFTLKRKMTVESEIIPFKARVHLSCAFWHSECYFNRQTNTFQGLLKIKDKKWRTACKVCDKTNGAVIDCNHTGCSKSYHPECARKTNIYMSLIRIGKLSKETFCQKHRIKYSFEKLLEKRQENLSALKKLYAGIERSLGYQGFYEKRERKQLLKSSKSKRREEGREGEKKFCICRQSDTGGSMIECEKCFEWFHFECVRIKNVSHFVCPFCKPKF